MSVQRIVHIKPANHARLKSRTMPYHQSSYSTHNKFSYFYEDSPRQGERKRRVINIHKDGERETEHVFVRHGCCEGCVQSAEWKLTVQNNSAVMECLHLSQIEVMITTPANMKTVYAPVRETATSSLVMRVFL